MSFLFEKAREGFLDGTIDWDTSTINAFLMDLNITTDNGVKAISAVSAATPPRVTTGAQSPQWATGDFVYINGVIGGSTVASYDTTPATGAAFANGLFKITSFSTTQFDLARRDGVNVAWVAGAYASGGYAVNLGPSIANFADYDACIVGAAVALASKTVLAGVADAADSVFTSISGASIEAIGIYMAAGRMIQLMCGYHLVVLAADVATPWTTLWVEPLDEAIPTGAKLFFSNGYNAVVNGAVAAGARSIAVTGLANNIAAGNQALAPATGAGFPLTPNGNNINVTWPAGANAFFRL